MGALGWAILGSLIAGLLIATLPPTRKFLVRQWLRLWDLWTFTGRLRSYGISNLFARRSDYVRYRKQATIAEYLETAKHSITYVGFWLAHGTEMENISTYMPELLKQGRTVTFVLMQPNSAHLETLSAYMGIPADQVARRIKVALDKFQETKQSLSPSAGDRFSVRVHNAPITASAFLLDLDHPSAKILVDFKVYGHSREDSFGIELRGPDSPMFRKFATSYRSIVDASSTL